MLVVAVTLAALLGAGAWLLVRSQEYRATSQVLVTPASYGDATYVGLPVPRDAPRDPTRVVQTAAAMLDSPAAATLTARRLGSDWSARRVRAAVSVEPKGESDVLAVQASADRPRLAARIADTFAVAALERRRQALGGQAGDLIARLRASDAAPRRQLDRLEAVRAGVDPTFSLLTRATVPGSAVGTRPWRILVLALFAGAVLGCAAALVSDVVSRRRRTEDELVELRGLPSRVSARRS